MVQHCDRRPRFIPAGAGNTLVARANGTIPPVYPRWRGEHGHSPKQTQEVNGLSPLARGTPGFHLSKCWMWRFIPAGAGNTSAAPANVSAVTVYPRWRGEHPRPSIISCASFGLSPLARGTHQEADESARHARFIPAGAGNTQFHMSRRAGSSVYPRWRGEHTKHT